MKISIFPKCHWSDFKDTKEVEKLIWDTLKVTGVGGSWDYHNFTSDSSLWSNGDYSLTLRYMAEDRLQSIELMNPEPRNAELNLLVEIFLKQYGLVSKYC
ncbi:hypothetical protein [Pseudoalteromonas xiamenensis]